MSVNKKLADLKKAFVGISEFRFRSVSEDFVSNMEWEFEVPILRDSFNFDISEPSFEEKFLHGESIPYVSVATPGSTSISFEVPSVDKDILDWLLSPAENAAVTGVADEVNGVSGTWAGGAYKLDNKVVQGMIMIISEDRTKAIVIKNFKGYAAPNMADISTTPVSFVVSASLESSQSASNRQGDILFLDFSKAA